MGLDEFLFLLRGLQWTVALTAIGFIGGAVAGLAIALARTSGNRHLRRATAGYIALFQGTPLLMQLFVVYYGLASLPAVRASVFWPILRDAFACATERRSCSRSGRMFRRIAAIAFRRADDVMRAAGSHASSPGL